jgi:hypothetical protein
MANNSNKEIENKEIIVIKRNKNIYNNNRLDSIIMVEYPGSIPGWVDFIN